MATHDAKEFARTLERLGFSSAKCTSYEWLGVEQQVVPILNAITKIFTSKCVLTPEEAAFASCHNSTIHSNAEELTDAKRVLALNLEQKSLQQERQKSLETTKQHLQHLNAQRAFLQDFLKRTEQDKINLTSDSAIELDTDVKDLSLNTELDGILEDFKEANVYLQVATTRNTDLQSSTQAYASTEESQLKDLKKVIELRLQDISKDVNKPNALQNQEVQTLIHSYAECQAKRWAIEGATVRFITIRNYLRNHDEKVKTFKMSELSSSSVLEKLKVQSKETFTIKYDEVFQNSLVCITNEIREYNDQQRMRKQAHIVESIIKGIQDLSWQRVRINCSKYLIEERKEKWERVLDIDVAIGKPYEVAHIQHSQRRKISRRSVASKAITKQVLEFSDNSMADIFSDYREALGFAKAIKRQTTEIDSYIRESGLHSHCNLVSHPRYPRMVKEFNEVIESNTVVLNAILRSMSSMSYSSQPSQDSRKRSNNSNSYSREVVH